MTNFSPHVGAMLGGLFAALLLVGAALRFYGIKRRNAWRRAAQARHARAWTDLQCRFATIAERHEAGAAQADHDVMRALARYQAAVDEADDTATPAMTNRSAGRRTATSA